MVDRGGFTEDQEAYRMVDPEGAYTRLLVPYGPMMSSTEVAEFLGVSRQRAGEMCRTGEIPEVPRPRGERARAWLIPKLCLLKYLTCRRAIPEIEGTSYGEDGE